MPINLSTLLNASANIQLAKAWVNFDGTTVTPSTIRSSYNVSSVTKNGTGDYTVNFATAMADANYSITLAVQTPSESDYRPLIRNSSSPSTSSLRVTNHNTSGVGGTQDPTIFCVQIFGN